MIDNEYKILESLIMYHKRKNELELTSAIIKVNERINKLQDKIDELMDELKHDSNNLRQ